MKTIVFFGDSLTEGRIGASYIERIQRTLGPDVRLINAGINGDTTYHLLRRLQADVVAHDPDIVVVQVGLNDMGTANPTLSQRFYYRFVKGVPWRMLPHHYAHGLRLLLHKLHQQTRAQLLLCTFTTLSEDPDDYVQHYVDAYNIALRAVALEEHVPIIDLRSAFLDAMRTDPRPGIPYTVLMALQDMAAVRWRGVTYTQLTEQRGFRLLCDGVHMAEAGADLMAETILPQLYAILNNTPNTAP